MNDFDSFDEPSIYTVRGNVSENTLGRIDQYDIVRKLGAGGFGVVYLVRDTISNVEYAIKTIHPLLKSNPEEIENLRQQFILVSNLTHSNIASAMLLHSINQVVYADEEIRKDLRLSTGDLVMLMKYAPGVTCSKWRKQFSKGKVPTNLAINICRQVAHALDYAHFESVIHRDIKPSNIMVETKENGSIVARVLDFGLAAEIRSSMSRVSTNQFDTSGTRPYMAPEQWQGRRQGPATDQYALACMFYELVSGAVPFAGAFQTGDAFIMLNSVKTEEPEYLDELTENQNQALKIALSKNPKDRFSDCSSFIDSLDENNQDGFGPSIGYVPFDNLVVCQYCNFGNDSNSIFCKNCGSRLERENICKNCGTPLYKNQKFCINCGAQNNSHFAKSEFKSFMPIDLQEFNFLDEELTAPSIIVEEENSALNEDITYGSFLLDNESSEKREIIDSLDDNIVINGVEFIKLDAGFFVGKYQITQEQWCSIMGDNPSFFQGNPSLPVENVTWYDCQKFISLFNETSEAKEYKLNFTLPTFEQWVYASRANSKRKFGLLSNGAPGRLDQMGWYNKNSNQMTHPVGEKEPNAWGLYDMHGNVWEWTLSEEHNKYIYCGGSYFSYHLFCASDYHLSNDPGAKFNFVGLRLAANPQP